MAVEINPLVLLLSFAGSILAPTLAVYLLLAYRLEEGLETVEEDVREVEEEVKQIEHVVETTLSATRTLPNAVHEPGPGPGDATEGKVSTDVEVAPTPVPEPTETADGGPSSEPADHDPDDGTRYLVVDDDPLVRQVLARYIVSNGVPSDRVATAADADETLARYEEHRPDVVLLDVEMPGPGGPAIAAELREADPQVDIALLTSIEADDPRIRNTVRKLGTGYVQKPVEPEDLADPEALTDPPAWADG